MANIKATIKSAAHIIANTVPLTKTQSNPPIELKNNVPAVSQSYLHSLLDVTEGQPQDDYTLIYNANTKKYEVRSLPVGEVALDGGNF